MSLRTDINSEENDTADLHTGVKMVHAIVMRTIYGDDVMRSLKASDLNVAGIIEDIKELGYRNLNPNSPMRNQCITSEIAANNIAKAIKFEYDICKEIVSEMREAGTRLETGLSQVSNRAYQKMAKFVVVRQSSLVENGFRTYQAEMEEEAGNKLHGIMNFDSIVVTPDTISGFLDNIDPILQSATEVVLELEYKTSLMKAFNNVKNHDLKTSLDIGVAILLRSFFKKNEGGPETINTLSRLIVAAYEKQTRDVFVIGQDAEHVYLNGKYYDQFIELHDPSILVALHDYTNEEGQILESYDEVVEEVVELRRVTSLLIQNIENNISTSNRINIKRICQEIVDEGLNLTKTGKKRMAPLPEDKFALIRVISKFVSELTSEELKNTEKIIEKLFLNVFFKDTTFSKFYTFVGKVDSADIDPKLSTGVVFLSTLALMQ